MAKPEIKVTITESGSDKTAAGIAKVDQAADKASKGGLSSLTSKLPGVDSALGKIPGGSALASGGIGALGAAATAGGAALVGFAVAGVKSFEDTTLAVGKFRDSTGTTAEEASKLTEVFNDLGVGSDAGAAAIGKMEKALGANSEAFSKYGVEVVKAKDGTIDAQGTFLNAVDALNKIEDPTKRAAAGAAIFGKGWQSMSEIITSGSGPLKQALESVQPSKIFTDKDIKSGRDLRDGFDAIKDAGEGLLLTVGKALAPVIAALAPKFGDVIAAVTPLAQEIGEDLASALTSVIPLLDVAVKGAGYMTKAFLIASDSTKLWANNLQTVIHGKTLEATAEDLGLVTGAIDTNALALYKSRQAFGAAAVSLGEWADETAKAFDAQANAQKQFKDAADALQKWAEKTAKAIELTDEYNNTVKGMDWGKAGIEGGLKAMSDYTDQHFALKNIEAQTESAMDSFTDAIKKNKFTFDLNTEAGRDNQKALEDVAHSLDTKLAAAYDDANGDMDVFKDKANAIATDTLSRMQKELGLSDDQVKALAESLGLADGDWEARFKLSGAAEAQQKLDLLNVSLDDFDSPTARQAYMEAIVTGDYEKALAIYTAMVKGDKSVYYDVYTRYHTSGDRGSTGATPPERARGGPVSAGEVYTVGEQGAELFVPDQDGTIIPHGASMSRGAGGGQPIVINTGLDERALVQVLNRYARRGGRNPWG